MRIGSAASRALRIPAKRMGFEGRIANGGFRAYEAAAFPRDRAFAALRRPSPRLRRAFAELGRALAGLACLRRPSPPFAALPRPPGHTAPPRRTASASGPRGPSLEWPRDRLPTDRREPPRP